MKPIEYFRTLVEKSISLDPWVRDKALEGYCKEIRNEAEEVVEAIGEGDTEHLREELGDVFYDWAHACKLKGRKPFILEDRKVTKDEAVQHWMKAKENERAAKQKYKGEYVYLVDKDDNVIGSVSRKDSVCHNLWHRGTAILVVNSENEILIHKRSGAADRFPLFYDIFFGGNVSFGETYEQSAGRELLEETGLKGEPDYLFKFTFESEESKMHCMVFRVESNGPIAFQKEEVEEAYFIPVKKLREMLKTEKFCPDSIRAFEIYTEKYGA